ncbi:hypothetical protein BH10PSE19_BH10PSE19_21960 [soil metagenome]
MANLPKMPNLNDLKNMADSSGILNKAKAMFDSITSSIGGVPIPLSEEALADPVRAKLYECELLLQQLKDGHITHMKLINNLDLAVSQLNKLIVDSKPVPTVKAEPEIKVVSEVAAAPSIEVTPEKKISETDTAKEEKPEDKQI